MWNFAERLLGTKNGPMYLKCHWAIVDYLKYTVANSCCCSNIADVYCTFQEFLKGVAELEGQLDTLEGLGMLLAGGCVAEDKEVILQRASELRLETVLV